MNATLPNYPKQQRYARAHERLGRALEHGFYIEAAMICESIISDRLHSHLHWRIEVIGLESLDELKERLKGMGIANPKISLQESATLFILIRAVELDFNDLSKPHYQYLPQRLVQWSKFRNHIAHNIAYTTPSSKSYKGDFSAFLATARSCAEQGQVLSTHLSNWDRAARNRLKKISS